LLYTLKAQLQHCLVLPQMKRSIICALTKYEKWAKR
jgi:hypothetical protein